MAQNEAQPADQAVPKPCPTVKCPKCFRRPSSRGTIIKRPQASDSHAADCDDPIHDLADRLVAEHQAPGAVETPTDESALWQNAYRSERAIRDAAVVMICHLSEQIDVLKAAPPSAERILTQAADEQIIRACVDEVESDLIDADEAKWGLSTTLAAIETTIRSHFPAVPSSGKQAVVMPTKESLLATFDAAWDAWSEDETDKRSPEAVYADAVMALLNPAPSGTASETERAT